jgi:hypothetical protein
MSTVTFVARVVFHAECQRRCACAVIEDMPPVRIVVLVDAAGAPWVYRTGRMRRDLARGGWYRVTGEDRGVRAYRGKPERSIWIHDAVPLCDVCKADTVVVSYWSGSIMTGGIHHRCNEHVPANRRGVVQAA